MRKTLILFSALALLFGCEKIEEINHPIQDESVNLGETFDALPEVLHASVADEQNAQTRTYVEGKTIFWHNGDAISFFAGKKHNVQYVYNGETPASKVELDKVDATGTSGNLVEFSRAVYPYDPETTVVFEDGFDKIYVTYPDTQIYAPDSFGRGASIMIATGANSQDDEMHFRNACGFLVIKLYGNTNVKNITLSSVSGIDKITGAAVIVTDEDNLPVVTMADDASTAVTLDCTNDGSGVALGTDKEHATEFWFALPPVEFEGGIKIVVTDMNDQSYTKQTNKTVSITRNNVQPMAALEFVSNVPASNKIWYTKADEGTTPLTFYDNKKNPFDATISKHYFDEQSGKFVIEFSSPVTTIQAYAFRDTKLQTITLPEGLVNIEKEVFRNSKLTEISVPGSVNTIGVDVFYDCDALSSITFEPSANNTPLGIGYQTQGGRQYGPFYDSPLTSINLNRELVYKNSSDGNFTADEWDEGLFSNEDYDKVESVTVTLGNQVKTLPEFMFSKLRVQTLTIPGSVTTIENDVFRGCNSLTSITFEPSPTDTPITIGYDTDSENENLFQDNNKLATLNLDREIVYTLTGVDTASEGAFGGMTTLTSVTLGKQVKTLTPYMFASSRITSLTIPSSVTSIAQYAFDDCIALSTLIFEESTEPVTIMGQGNGVAPFYDSPLTTIGYNRNFNYMKVNGTEEFKPNGDGNGIFAINPDLKAGITSPSTVNIGSYIETIPNRMFCNLAITTLTIPGTVNRIGNDVFNGCSKLQSLTFKPSETSPATDLKLGWNTDGEQDGPFLNSPITELNLNRQIDYDLINNGLDADDEGVFSGRPLTNNEGHLVLGDQVTSLSPYMFSNTQLTSIDLNNVTSIGYAAFQNASRLTGITIPNTLESIGINAFLQCTNLSSVDLEDGSNVLTIGYQKYNTESWGPFYDSPLATINLGRELKYVKENDQLFTPTEWEEGVFANGKYENVDNVIVTITNNVKTISSHMFNCLKLQSITIPASVTSIEVSAFEYCDYLNTVNFADGTDTITIACQDGEYGTFYDSPLTSVTLGREVYYVNEKGNSFTPDESDEGLFTSEDTVPSLSVTLTNNVKTISAFMFANRPVQEITIPGSVTKIANFAFDDCSKLERISFEAGDTDLHIGYQDHASDKGPFYDSPLRYIHLNRDMVYDYNDLDAKDEGIFSYSFNNTENLNGEAFNTVVEFGNKVKNILPYMFSGIRITADLTIPENITTIGAYAFADCKTLKTIKLMHRSTLPTLDWVALEGCSNLNTIMINHAIPSSFSGTAWNQYVPKIHRWY